MQFLTLIFAVFTATLASALPNPHPPRDHGPIEPRDEPRDHPRVCPSADYCASNPAGLPDNLNPAIPHPKKPTTLLTETQLEYTTVTGTTTAIKEEETTSYTTIISTRTPDSEVETAKPFNIIPVTRSFNILPVTRTWAPPDATTTTTTSSAVTTVTAEAATHAPEVVFVPCIIVLHGLRNGQDGVECVPEV